MANKHKGEVEFESGGKTYKLSFSANAMCEIEDAIEMGADELIGKFNNGETVRLGVLRKVFWQGLRDYHPDMTLDDTKLVLKGVAPPDMARLITDALRASMPAVPSASAGEGGANPPQPGEPAAG